MLAVKNSKKKIINTIFSNSFLFIYHQNMYFLISFVWNSNENKKVLFIDIASRIHNPIILWESLGLHSGSYSLWSHMSWLHPGGSMVAWFQECLMVSLWEEICVFHAKMKGEETDMVHTIVPSVCKKALCLNSFFFITHQLIACYDIDKIWCRSIHHYTCSQSLF